MCVWIGIRDNKSPKYLYDYYLVVYKSIIIIIKIQFKFWRNLNKNLWNLGCKRILFVFVLSYLSQFVDGKSGKMEEKSDDRLKETSKG